MRTMRALPILASLAATLMVSAGCSKKPVAKPPPTEVLVAQVTQQDIPIHSEWTGVLDGFVNATIRAQVPGYLMRQGYREGSKVKKATCSSRLIRGRFRPCSTRRWRNWLRRNWT